MPTSRRVPVVTFGVILLNVLIYFFGASFSQDGLPAGVSDACSRNAFVQHYGAVPKELTANQQLPIQDTLLHERSERDGCPETRFDKSPALSALTSLFVHGGLGHLLGNMAYLLLFGPRVERRFGAGGFALFYLVCGYTAAYAFAFTQPTSITPLIGASGAIAGVLGAHLWLTSAGRLALASWFGVQIFYADGGGVETGAVAYVAHVVGFAVGLLLAMLFVGVRDAPRAVPATATPARTGR